MASTSLTSRLRNVRLWPQKRAKASFISLPVEIRRLIYYYVLLAPADYKPYPTYTPTTVQLSWTWPWASYIPPRLQLYKHTHWGQSSMSLLFLLNHQLRAEAEEFFYSSGRFIFAWPRCECACCVPVFLGKRSLKARDMGGVYLRLLVNTQVRMGYRNEQAFFEAILRELKALRKVVVCVRFLGGIVDEEELEWIVVTIVRLVGVFRGVKKVELEHDVCEATEASGLILEAPGVVWEQRVRMVEEARGRIEGGRWGQLEELGEGFCRCEEKTKAWVTKHIL